MKHKCLYLSGEPCLEAAVEDASGCGTGEVSAVSKLRRSPRKNKWAAGKPAGSGAPGETRQAAKKEKSHKKVARWWHMQMECTIVCVCLQRLEQIIVVALKKKGMQRDHMSFRKCYNRLFTLSKSFLKVYTYTSN